MIKTKYNHVGRKQVVCIENLAVVGVVKCGSQISRGKQLAFTDFSCLFDMLPLP